MIAELQRHIGTIKIKLKEEGLSAALTKMRDTTETEDEVVCLSDQGFIYACIGSHCKRVKKNFAVTLFTAL